MKEGTDKITLYHGSSNVIEHPVFGKGNPANDYGLGFYCTESLELAKEWACGKMFDGFANKYEFSLSGLSILNLSGNNYTILNWLAVLLNNRSFSIKNAISEEGRSFLLNKFLIDITPFDAIRGYRADDSYFSFAQDFLNNTISLQKLEHVMKLGNLGEQIVLKSKKAFSSIQFETVITADYKEYFFKREKRDNEAREEYLKNQRQMKSGANEVFLIDIIRNGGVI